MFHNLYLSTQPSPSSSLSTFIAHVSQSLSLSTAPPPIFISHPSTFLTTPHHGPPSSSLISQLFSQHPSTSSSLISLNLSLRL
ncbi:hypothetical protein NC653_008147 [Populus alba x Populus x berolinensis]|uniref:Uncharacterized protein n=1 Tax=Populus alba x Populus x berolinensis TaxID=444605 RepID=A0AAD6R5Q4_9ROSI|nr:hypothetical protein NC653_008147 [Populus alba x Populus x berolinensis]